jgi:Domain of unknown function (DUF4397)
MDSNVYNFQQYLENSSPPWGYIRVLHAVTDAPNVDVYANETLIFNDLAFGEYTPYLPLPEGRYKIEVYVAGAINDPILTNNLTNNEGAYLTVGLTGTLDDIAMVGIVDKDMPVDPGKAMIRFAHLSPNAPSVDLTLPNGNVIFDDVSFREITTYMDVLPMNYTFQIRGAGTTAVVLTVPDVDPQTGKYYTIYAIGLVADQPELEALVLTDGEESV